MHKVMMPRFDPVMQTGKIVQWVKKEGEEVKKGETIVIVEGEKTTFEIEAPISGKIVKIIFPEGSEVKVSDVIAEIRAEVEEAKKEIVVKASPLAKKIAREYGIDLAKVKGTGPNGLITKEDVLKVIEEKKEKGLIPELEYKSIKLTQVRKTIAERLSYSFRVTVPVMVSTEVFYDDLLKLRGSLKREGLDSSITSFLVKAVALALKEHEILNSSLEGDEIRIYKNINICVAVDAPQGLVAPVIKDADKLSVFEISKRIDELVKRAKENKLEINDLVGGTFTVSNLGGFGIDLFIPIINPPQCAILGVGRITKRLRINEEGDFDIRDVGNLCLIFDHRIVDGAPASRFLRRVKELLENPYYLLIEK
jgi:pyruvate dehydrogenase E2 component (dihydrolipoamide acetyltransferase)